MFVHILTHMQEGPHSALNEEEFFDALEMAYQNDEMEVNVSYLDSIAGSLHLVRG